MARRSKSKYIFSDDPCIRCGVNLVSNCTIEPLPSGHPAPKPWQGVCEQCWTAEERRMILGSGAAGLATGWKDGAASDYNNSEVGDV